MQVKDTKSLESEILNTLKYFQIFNFPLSKEEIHRFLNVAITVHELEYILKNLKDDGNLHVYRDLYMLYNDSELAARRIKGGKMAQLKMIEARQVASRISKFPFVTNVCISGSLSKGYADENSDIDLFIVTQKHRLWISRTILHIYKKFKFLTNKQKSYCMNYFIDESRLTIDEQNLFTATELVTLIPVYNTIVYKELIESNKHWLTNIYPNIKWDLEQTTEAPKLGLKTILEGTIDLLFPKMINSMLMRITDSWWRFKWRKRNYPMEDYDLAMKTKWYVSKNHPANYQKKILEKLQNIQHIPIS